ncbi:MAG: LysM peptidoglycan-binding domain-containing protein [Clostridiaceae bacterium]|nr:LysM peptidoglycan-binding domain-containing protein [Clostridiaceae bacterium]
MKRRYVLKNKKRFITMILLLIVISFFTGLIVSAGAESEIINRDYKTIKVEKGDTLWEIAVKHGQNMDPRAYIYEIKKVNNLGNSFIYAGQELLLP